VYSFKIVPALGKLLHDTRPDACGRGTRIGPNDVPKEKLEKKFDQKSLTHERILCKLQLKSGPAKNEIGVFGPPNTRTG